MLNNNYSYDQLTLKVHNILKKVPDHRTGNNIQISLSDCLMSTVAMFSLKDASLLQFVNESGNRRTNLKNVYHIKKVGSDTTIRALLDKVKPSQLQDLQQGLLSDVATSGLLNDYLFLDQYLPCSIDGTGYFSSKSINCTCCCETHHKDGSITYHHKCLAAVLVHPDKREVFSLDNEDIIQQDGATKNDCELNASKRLIPRLKAPIAGCKLLFLEDALYANGPHIEMILGQGNGFIIGIKPTSQSTLFDTFEQLQQAEKTKVKKIRKGNIIHYYEYANQLALNQTYPDLLVNMVIYRQIDLQTGKLIAKFCFITNIELNTKTVDKVVKVGRARWKIENETFNTLKNQGYNYEHNYGHGHLYLATNLSRLMFIAFLIDQIVQACDRCFRYALAVKKTKKALWKKIRQLFDLVEVKNMETIYKIITGDIKLKIQFVT